MHGQDRYSRMVVNCEDSDKGKELAMIDCWLDLVLQAL